MPGEPSPDDTESRYVELRDTRIRYTDQGQGDAIVLVHGFASSLDTWNDLAPHLAEAHRVVTLDLKGFGWSDRPDSDYSVAEQARIVLELADHLSLSSATFVGHSYGAAVVLDIALRAPERVAGLALYDAFVYEDQLTPHLRWAQTGLGGPMFATFYNERPDDRMALAFHDPDMLGEELVEAVEAALERPGTRAAALAAVRGMELAPLSARYSEVSQPTLLLWGHDDGVTPLRFGERLAGDLPNAELRVFTECGHFPMIEAEAASTAALMRWLEGGR